MPHITGSDLTHLLVTYGYLAVLIFVAIESTGIPFPGETMLIAASIYAGTTHNLNIVFVIAAAAIGAILGDNLGFWVGREGGYRLLRRFGHVIRLDERKLKLGQYLFLRHGGKVVFFGRFVAVLRAWAAFLAGTNRMAWPEFLAFNAAGGIVWATLYGLGGYLLGSAVQRIAGPFGTITLVLAAIIIVASFFFLHHNQQRLEDEAERVLPGSLDDYQPGGRRFKDRERIAAGEPASTSEDDATDDATAAGHTEQAPAPQPDAAPPRPAPSTTSDERTRHR
jgi:membrane protein DedA with SNARE-associated domain